MTYNNQVIQLMDERAAERQQRKAVVISDERRAADRAAKNCDRMVNAYALIDANEHRYDTLITNLTADQTEWRQRYEGHQRTAKRVSVKSSVVGNHLYSTARGWTWAQLIDDGKALLAIDPEDDTRIRSTDRKADKAGGLYLALAGTLVRPDDDVDDSREYTLVPLPE